jgi:hypothetical protein
VKGSEFDELSFFRAIQNRGPRALLIGRRALVVLGLPVLTADYDFWIDIENIETFNQIAGEFDLHPSKSPEEARQTGRYVLENDEHIDVLVARSVSTVQGIQIQFSELWQRRIIIPISTDVSIALPSIDDLINTKRFAARVKDLEDIRLLEGLRRENG